ncbi:30946_t:CDS:1 [Gigaspora margarita]|uniref:30946_t:CDS:1 n=1 Tax=Gigaspora margarita TaxID=4874 RepID=A0ABN7VF46_GIGMA|nr:30946_t:CDS:1 [Gigaspora margarita]
MPDSLARFKKEIQKNIIEWFETTKNNNNDRNDPEEDDYNIDPSLLVIEWDDNAIRNRGIQKNNIIAGMSENNFKTLFCCVFLTIFQSVIQGFNGCQPLQRNIDTNVGTNNVAPSGSIFIITDTRTADKRQIAEDIVLLLRQMYFQRGTVSMGRVYEVEATRKGFFDVKEFREVF